MTTPGTTRVTGVVPPVCTPLTAGLEVDVPSLERLVDHLVDGGVDGLFVLGSSSEAAYLPDRHRRVVVETVTQRVAGQVPVLAGAIDMTTLRVLDHAEAAAKAGCQGLVATAPFYTRTHPAEIETHFRLVAEKSGLPLYAYDLPVSVHSKLDGEMLLRLAVEGVLAGVKDSSGDDGAFRELVLARADAGPAAAGFSLMTGSETVVDALLRLGADGVVPGLGNVDPAGYARLAERAGAGDWDAAQAEQERLMRLFAIVKAGDPARMGGSSRGLGAFKAALHLLGVIDCPVPAPPQVALNDGETAVIKALLIEAGLL